MARGRDPKKYYQALGLEAGASMDEIHAAYKRKLGELHPNGATRRRERNTPKYQAMSEKQKEEHEAMMNEKASLANEAYDVLRDKTKKHDYDTGAGEYAEFPGFGAGGFSTGGFGGFGDIFSHFTGGSRRQKKYKLKDIVCELRITMQESFLGKMIKSKKIKRTKLCDMCGGKKAKELNRCGRCNGNGVVVTTTQLGMMITQTEGTCPDCNGRGEIPKGDKCNQCSIDGTIGDMMALDIKIRPGVIDGEEIRFKGKGNEKYGYVSGDIVFIVKIMESSKYQRIDDHIISSVEIDLLSALTGGVAYFNHPDGRNLAVNFGPFNNFKQVLVLYGEGYPDRRGKKGNLYLRPDIKINRGLDRMELSKYIRPLVEKPQGEYTRISSSFGSEPEQTGRRHEEEDMGSEKGFSKEDFLRSFGFF